MSVLTHQQMIMNRVAAKTLLRPKDVSDLKGGRADLARLVDAGKLVKVGRGLYRSPESGFGENRTILEVAELAPSAVICLLSALRYHGLTTQNPREVWLAVEGTARRPAAAAGVAPIRVMRFSGDSFSEGIETKLVDGTTLRVYSPAKTVADCFKFRNKIGVDIAIEALRDALGQRAATVDEIWRMAKACRVANVMRPYLESLV